MIIVQIKLEDKHEERAKAKKPSNYSPVRNLYR